MTIDTVDREFATRFVAQFVEVWQTGDPDRFAALWADDIVLIQPLMRTLRGKRACRAGFAHLFTLIPDLTATVHSFGHGEHEVFVAFTLSGTFGARPIAWDAVDRFTFTDGLVVERVSYFDPTPVAARLLGRPRGWGRLIQAAPSLFGR